ncbi:3-hydroxyacyl-CoA dehydrogenase [Salinarimonas ramus]|uniref:3-hydroxyacyl-CoA dehydrogenase n=1 Tax=Salinarimonas ramus TaxID=690164 RepID=A0A917QI22_9HYPH|nr:3-hydroxyacyl-CoA dehydrogenase [Salinarimonas ramus]GGK50763.1 3-hydroxyacyl-CoA dehydrogenase [Salinarimonas ramus]
MTTRSFAVIGAGSIGVAFALVFARAGHEVRVVDPDPARRAAIDGEIVLRLDDLSAHGLFDGDAAAVRARIAATADLAAGVADAALVMECAPEDEGVKRALFAEIAAAAPADAILASASSAIGASRFAADLPEAARARCLVAHPGNPPTLIPVIELVPAPFTAPETMDDAERLLEGCGMRPVRLGREVEGFVYNRLQGAMLREAYCLVRDGIISANDLDTLVRDGLGLRWSVVGPFATADLNVRGGISAHAKRMGAAYARMGAERGQDDPWTDDLVARVDAERRALLPLERWEEGVRARDVGLMRALAARRGAPGTGEEPQ